jgi:uncharacterized membrane protein
MKRFDLALWLVRLALVTAIVIAGYLAYASIYTGGEVAGCGDAAQVGCGHVLASRWATWLGIPVGLPAVLIYVMAIASTWLVSASPGARSQLGWSLLAGSATLIGGAAIWFIGLQLLSLGNLCWYCLALHACGLLMAGFVAWRLPQQLVAGTAPIRSVVIGGMAGMGFLLTLVGGQLLVAPRRPGMHITEIPAARLPIDIGPKTEAELTDSQPAAAPSHPTADHPWPHRRLSLLGGTVPLDTYGHPVIGNREALRPIVEIFDYTCPQCRELHGMLQQARAELGNSLAIVLVPIPLDPGCNKYATEQAIEHATACELARIALAVWQARPEAFEQFHHSMMQGAEAPSPAAAEAAAIKLVGEAAFRKAISSPAVEKQLQENCRIYGSVRQSTGESALPKLIYDLSASSGLPSSMNELRDYLK